MSPGSESRKQVEMKNFFHLMLLKRALDCLCISICFSVLLAHTVLTFPKFIGFVFTNKKVEKTMFD